MSDNRVHVTVTIDLGPQGVADGCAVASLVGDVRAALETGERFTVRHAGKLVGLVGTSADEDATYRNAIRVSA